MIIGEVKIQSRSGIVRRYECPLSPWEASSLRGEDGVREQESAGFAVFKRALVRYEIEDREIRGFSVMPPSRSDEEHGLPAIHQPAEGDRRVHRCRSVLNLAKAALPRDIRDDYIDEWMDEIECAAARNRPVLPRVMSILVRSLPILTWRSRIPTRVRRPGSQ